jgi:hypothetical protein
MNSLTVNQFNSTAVAADDNPNAEIFTANRTWEWLGRVTGAYVLPWEVMLSGVVEHRSGLPWARQVLFSSAVLGSLVLNMEPIGTQRMPNTTVLDIRAEKSFRLPRGQVAKLRFNLYNVLNANTVTGLVMRSGSAFGRPTSILTPRIGEVGVAFNF